MTRRKRRLGTLLFPHFETLDVFGPLQIFGSAPDLFEIVTVAQTPGAVTSTQGQAVIAAAGFADCPPLDLMLVPGGIGTRGLVDDSAHIGWIEARSRHCELTMSVCTGAALLARAGVLDGLRATTNKRAFEWVVAQGPAARWLPRARWVDSGRVVTAAGVSAGIDMALAVVARLGGVELAERLALHAEYEWHDDPDRDPFAGPARA